MMPSNEQPEYVVATRPGAGTGDEILITNKGNEWIRGYDDRTGSRNAELKFSRNAHCGPA